MILYPVSFIIFIFFFYFFFRVTGYCDYTFYIPVFVMVIYFYDS